MRSMQPIAFAAVTAGDRFNFTATLDAEHVDGFARLAGDTNPIHCDDLLAREQGFRARIVHGALLSGMVAGFLGSRFAAPASLCLSQKAQFPQPVYIGDSLEFLMTVIHKSDGLRTVVVEFQGANQDGTIVVVGEMTIKVLAS